ncbi:MAG: prepilin-type N-terminal cleavage/methylation domain-containing protein [Chthonomonadetes bacterium]|nr:prepilin-type N-terminal cleavage/methylation domain-containing protein [Chthonomonadetes bacterium]
MRHAKAFTLLEMLTVVAIIALLVALLLPLLNSARRHAQVSPCMNNLKQLHSALTMYRDDYGLLSSTPTWRVEISGKQISLRIYG